MYFLCCIVLLHKLFKGSAAMILSAYVLFEYFEYAETIIKQIYESTSPCNNPAKIIKNIRFLFLLYGSISSIARKKGKEKLQNFLNISVFTDGVQD